MKPKRHSSGKVLATLLLTASTLVLLGFGSFASATTSSDLSSAPANSTVQADETEDTGTNGSTSTPNPGPGEVPSSTSEEPQGESTPGEDESTDSSNTEVDSSAQPEEEEGTAPMEPYGISPQALSNIRDYPEFTPITDGVEFKFSDANGNPVDPDQVHVGDDFTLSFDLNFTPELWAAIQAGDYYDIEMPDGFEIAFANGPFLILGPGPDFKVLATIEETPDGMRLVFTDAFKEAPVTEGEFYVTGKVAQEVGDGAGNIEVEFPTEENLPPTNITVRPDTTDSIDKQGYFDRTPNPNQVTWTVNANKQVDTLNGFTVTDTLPPGLSVSGDSDIVVYKYTMGFDGNPVSGSKVPLSNPGDYTIEYDTDGNPKVVFNGTVDYPVEITYTTTIEPASKPDGAGTISYENKVSTTADEISEDISASATVVGRWVDSLEKELENYDPESQQFSWLVHYNYRGIPSPRAPVL